MVVGSLHDAIARPPDDVIYVHVMQHPETSHRGPRERQGNTADWWQTFSVHGEVGCSVCDSVEGF